MPNSGINAAYSGRTGAIWLLQLEALRAGLPTLTREPVAVRDTCRRLERSASPSSSIRRGRAHVPVAHPLPCHHRLSVRVRSFGPPVAIAPAARTGEHHAPRTQKPYRKNPDFRLLHRVCATTACGCGGGRQAGRGRIGCVPMHCCRCRRRPLSDVGQGGDVAQAGTLLAAFF
jgi:hypothetical protein